MLSKRFQVQTEEQDVLDAKRVPRRQVLFLEQVERPRSASTTGASWGCNVSVAHDVAAVS